MKSGIKPKKRLSSRCRRELLVYNLYRPFKLKLKTNLATIFKVDENKIDHLFTAPSAVIKKNINYDVAMQYQHALKKAGFRGPDCRPPSVIFTSAAR